MGMTQPTASLKTQRDNTPRHRRTVIESIDVALKLARVVPQLGCARMSE
jgi:hypothetical protein